MQSHPKSIMIVDDDEFVRDILTAAIESVDGFSVASFHSGIEAMREIVRLSPRLILLDLLLPDMDGLDLIRRIKAEPLTAGIPVIVLSGHDEPDIKRNALKTGASLFLTKPIGSAELRNHIERLIA